MVYHELLCAAVLPSISSICKSFVNYGLCMAHVCLFFFCFFLSLQVMVRYFKRSILQDNENSLSGLKRSIYASIRLDHSRKFQFWGLGRRSSTLYSNRAWKLEIAGSGILSSVCCIHMAHSRLKYDSRLGCMRSKSNFTNRSYFPLLTSGVQPGWGCGASSLFCRVMIEIDD